ncbi:MAG: 3-hydroxyacyl-CoA dehydrogenase [Candidatus Saccharibacteria bacterium]|nr:3-hydroxyacyl-CoA dehydrogenase [Moraxellaceae bacterium]
MNFNDTLQQKVALVTGGASGLGLATVRLLAEKGACVAIFDLNREQADLVALELGSKVRAYTVNVSDEVSVKTAIDQVMQDFGGLHIAVNCAGIGSASRTVGKNGPHSLELFTKVITINLIGTFNVTRLAAEAMQHNTPDDEDNERGVIINTASVAAFDGQIGQVAYSASKGGVVGMTLPLARDLAMIGVRVNTIAPGIFNTPLMNASPDSVKLPLIAMTQFPKRLGYPEEYAKLALHIVENSFMNGETIRLDGAIRMQPR